MWFPLKKKSTFAQKWNRLQWLTSIDFPFGLEMKNVSDSCSFQNGTFDNCWWVKFVDFTLNKHYHMLPEYLSYSVLRFRVFFPCIKHKTWILHINIAYTYRVSFIPLLGSHSLSLLFHSFSHTKYKYLFFLHILGFNSTVCIPGCLYNPRLVLKSYRQ